MPFPCRHTNADEWINVDLGVPLKIEPLEWRAWQRSKSPQPHQSSIYAPAASAARRLTALQEHEINASGQPSQKATGLTGTRYPR